MKRALMTAAACWAATTTWAATPRAVVQSARKVPVAREVDVVVVGGGTGAVSAAAAAARAGADVFLAAPRNYLGEDVCGTLRLWLPAGAVPTGTLAQKIFSPNLQLPGPTVDRSRVLPITYEADRPSTAQHKDTTPPSMLTDGLWGRPHTQSVQYDGDVRITAKLASAAEVERVCVMLYHTRDFQVAAVTASVSDDGKAFREVASMKNTAPPQKADPDTAIALTAEVGRRVRQVRFHIRKAPAAARILVGEVLLLKPAAGAASRPKAPAVRYRATPLHVKRTLDEHLLSAGVTWLHGCYVTDVLRDAAGKPCGIVMANRAGRQAVVAKVIVDGTERGVAARLAGAAVRPASGGRRTFKRIVIGGPVRTGEGLTAEHLPAMTLARAVRGQDGRRKRVGRPVNVIEYTLRLPPADDGFAAAANAENAARDMTYHPQQLWSSERLFSVPAEAIAARSPLRGEWPGAAGADLDAFRPAGLDRVYVVGGCADVPREYAETLMGPLAQIALGERVGAAAAAEAKALPPVKGARIPGRKADAAVEAGEVREVLVGVRPMQDRPTIPAEAGALPVLGDYDVVVIGGGTSGAPAGIGAARRGARTLVVEYQYALGGVGTLGLIGKYYHGYRGGFTREVDKALGRGWSVQAKMEWWRSELRKAAADVWFGCLGCGALVADGQVVGAVVVTPRGRGVVLARTVVDATGNADVAVAAGAETQYVDAVDVAVQGTGLPPVRLGANYTNTDFTITDESDVVDVTALFIYTRKLFGRAWDQGGLVDTRERRRIVGEATMTILDQVLARRYPDTIAQSRSDFDSHGYTTDPFFVLAHPRATRPHTPYRCLLPRGLEGLLATGLGFSAHRDAIPMTRMQPDLQNTGYAVGVAAAMAAKGGGKPRAVDVRALQKHLVAIGCLPESVLTDKDSFPVAEERVAAAVRSVADRKGKAADRDVAAILARPEVSLPLLREAYASAEGDAARLRYAQVLAAMGDATGVATLITAVEDRPEWDKGWNYRGMGQYGDNMSPMDKIIYVLGRARDPRAVPAILDKVKRLDGGSAFSHHRAVALALERLGASSAAGPLAELLGKPGVGGHVIDSVAASLERRRAGTNTASRRAAIMELMLARALYRCGDKDGLGRRVLTAYTRDVRGHLARHARAVLESGPRPLPRPAPGSRD